MLGLNEIIVVLVGLVIPVAVIYFIYKYAKNKGRLEEIERQRREKEGSI